MNPIESKTQILRGSCHCGAVKYEVEADPSKGGSRCNCTVCTKLAAFGSVVKPAAFKLLTPEAELGQYRWGGNVSTRFFCKSCGTHCFGRGFLDEVGGDYVSFNLNTVDALELKDLPVVYWDGRHDNWHAGPGQQPWPIFELAAGEPTPAA